MQVGHFGQDANRIWQLPETGLGCARQGWEVIVARIRIMNEDEAGGSVADDYAFISDSCSPGFGAVQNRVLTNDGRRDRPQEPVPGIPVMFGISMHGACYC